MEDRKLSTEELDYISRLQAQKDSEEHYTERPKFHRILAWICFGIVLIGFFFLCYWLMTPQL